MQLVPRLVDPVPVARVDDEDEALCPRVVVPPERADLVLPSYVLLPSKHMISLAQYAVRWEVKGRMRRTHPDVKLDVLVRDGLYVEADCRDGRDALVELELIQNS